MTEKSWGWGGVGVGGRVLPYRKSVCEGLEVEFL